jgi:hypothetical protein
MRHVLLAGVFALAATTAAQAGPPPPPPPGGLYLGGDLSYVNEMEDCGAVYRKGGKPVDPFALLKAEGGNIVRVRIWNDAKWTKYSDYDDVLKTIRRAKAAGMQVLLNFHYSDDWADGGKQITPAAWTKLARDLHASGKLFGASPLHPVKSARSVRVREGKTMVTDGPFAETREQLGGFYLVDAKDLDEAIAIASRIPPAKLGTVEIRPVLEIPGLPQDR